MREYQVHTAQLLPSLFPPFPPIQEMEGPGEIYHTETVADPAETLTDTDGIVTNVRLKKTSQDEIDLEQISVAVLQGEMNLMLLQLTLSSAEERRAEAESEGEDVLPALNAQIERIENEITTSKTLVKEAKEMYRSLKSKIDGEPTYKPPSTIGGVVAERLFELGSTLIKALGF